MHPAFPVSEGFVPFRGYRTWYCQFSPPSEEPGHLPLLCLHGGPGTPHDYLLPIEGLSASGRRVIFYDQLGNGRSDQPHDQAIWSVKLFVDELATLRRALGLERVHILGQSWGGMLAMEYALTQPIGLASLILANSLASEPQWTSEANRLRAELPPDVQATLTKHEAAGTTDDAEYYEAMLVFYRRHYCRADPWPNYVLRSLDAVGHNPEVYHTMWGPSEFFCTGKLRGWDIVHRLGEIRVPTLILSGRYDEATPLIAETLHNRIPGSEWVLFEHSAHMPHVEETERYLQVVGDFLSRIEVSH